MQTTLPGLIVAVDSDGTVLDAMNVKHQECFTPALIAVWGLQALADKVTETFLRINLRSLHRGVNRFDALGLLLRELESSVAPLPQPDVFFNWLATSHARSDATLQDALDAHPDDAALSRALEWSREVNRLCSLLPPPAPFPGAREALKAAACVCDVRVVSSGNGRAIRSEWKHAGLADLPTEFLTQEAGPKTTILRRLGSVLVAPAQILMLGDAPPDESSAREAGTRFFPIIPGHEAECWHAFQHEILPAFQAGKLDAATSDKWLRRFHATLGS